MPPKWYVVFLSLSIVVSFLSCAVLCKMHISQAILFLVLCV